MSPMDCVEGERDRVSDLLSCGLLGGGPRCCCCCCSVDSMGGDRELLGLLLLLGGGVLRRIGGDLLLDGDKEFLWCMFRGDLLLEGDREFLCRLLLHGDLLLDGDSEFLRRFSDDLLVGGETENELLRLFCGGCEGPPLPRLRERAKLCPPGLPWLLGLPRDGPPRLMGRPLLMGLPFMGLPFDIGRPLLIGLPSIGLLLPLLIDLLPLEMALCPPLD